MSEKYEDVIVENVRSFSGYYIFEMGDDSVIHFNVKGCKGWRFAAWITEDSKNKEKFTIEMFGQYERYIDKFKPSASPFSYTATIESLDDFDELGSSIDIQLYMFMGKIKAIRDGGPMRRWAIYEDDERFLKWWIHDMWYYNVVSPFDDFVKGNLTKWWLTAVAWIYTKRFKNKNNKKFHVNVLDNKGWLPRWVLQVVYEGTDTDTMYDIYHAIELKKGDERKSWLIPEWVYENSRVTHAYSDKDLRGFYYSKDEDNNNNNN